MIDTEVFIINELESDPVLSGLVGDKIFRYIVPDEFADQYPYIRVVEINNIDSDYTDNKAIASEIDIQIDFWTKDDPESLQKAIDRVMKSLQWKRIGVTSFYEEDTGAIRKALRYRTKIRLEE
jgi:Protein of unknown function (DUF3168)